MPKQRKERTIVAQYPDGTRVRMPLSEAHRRFKEMPIRHPDLPDELLEVARRLYKWVGKDVGRVPQGLERWEAGFMHDTNPDMELGMWVAIGLAADKLQSPSVSRRKVVRNLCLASIGGMKRTSREYVTLNEIGRSFEGRPLNEVYARIPDCYV